MSQACREKYLEAFGVPAFLYASPSAKTTSIEKINTQCLVIETTNNRSFCQAGKAQDFLLKMLGAIGLKRGDIECECINADDLIQTLGRYQAQAVLLMSPGLVSSSKRHFITHHPSEILINEQFKREAWEVLKQVQQCLK